MRRAIGAIIIAAVAFTAGAWAQSIGISLDQANTWSKDNGYMTGERYQDNITREQVNAVLMRYHCDKHGQGDPDCGADDQEKTTDDSDIGADDPDDPMVVELDWMEGSPSTYRGRHLYQVRSVPPLNRFNELTYKLVCCTGAHSERPFEWTPGDMLRTNQPLANGEDVGLTCEGIRTAADRRCELRVYQNGELTVIDGKLQDGLDPAPPSGQAEPYNGVWMDLAGNAYKPPAAPTPTDDHDCDNINAPEFDGLVFRLCYVGFDTDILRYRYALLTDTTPDRAGVRQAWMTHNSSADRPLQMKTHQRLINPGIGPHPSNLHCLTEQDHLMPSLRIPCRVEIYIEDELVWINGREIR